MNIFADLKLVLVANNVGNLCNFITASVDRSGWVFGSLQTDIQDKN